MIEATIIGRLLEDKDIKGYCNGNIFIGSAPEGTATPYIVVDADDDFDESGALSLFGVTINIYHYKDDIRPLRQASQKVIEALLFEELAGDGYSSVRLFFRGRHPIKEPDSNLSRVLIQFDARGCNDDLVNNITNLN